ncbi:MAG: carbohydrate kinase family protein [Patescibacteria group bacterium]|nr:carbohydrate kinase family protein [Patescibacteria group bacterium]
MFDVITIGSATRDVFLKGKFPITTDKLSFDLGSKNDVDEIFFFTGGGATNAAATFSNLGLNTACISRIGNDPGGKAVLEDLKKFGISQQFIVKTEDFYTAYSIIISTESGRVALVHRGTCDNFRESDIPCSKLFAKWLYVTSLSGDLKILKTIFDCATDKKIRIAWNPGNSEIKKGINELKFFLAKVGVLILNLDEAKELTGLKNKKDIFEKIDTLTDGIVVITDGMEGVEVCSGKTCYKAKALGGKAVESTGAGDAFGSGFVTGLILKNDINYAIQLASANASSVVTKIGAKNGLMTKSGLSRFNKVKVDNYLL